MSTARDAHRFEALERAGFNRIATRYADGEPGCTVPTLALVANAHRPG